VSPNKTNEARCNLLYLLSKPRITNLQITRAACIFIFWGIWGSSKNSPNQTKFYQVKHVQIYETQVKHVKIYGTHCINNYSHIHRRLVEITEVLTRAAVDNFECEYFEKKVVRKRVFRISNGKYTLLVHCLYYMLALNHKRTTSSLAPSIFYVAKKLAIKR